VARSPFAGWVWKHGLPLLINQLGVDRDVLRAKGLMRPQRYDHFKQALLQIGHAQKCVIRPAQLDLESLALGLFVPC
jgi:hypothetical protein